MNERIAALRSQILKAKQAYYYGDNALMTDAAYDALEEELAALSPNDDVLAIVGAPCPPDSLLAKAEHRIHMGSQSKVNSVAEFATWFEKSVPAEGEILAALKADGASAAAYYRDGRLEQAISRGDGVIGEDITANAVKFKGLPAYVSCPVHGPFTGAARFEVGPDRCRLATHRAYHVQKPAQPRLRHNGPQGWQSVRVSHRLRL